MDGVTLYNDGGQEPSGACQVTGLRDGVYGVALRRKSKQATHQVSVATGGLPVSHLWTDRFCDTPGPTYPFPQMQDHDFELFESHWSPELPLSPKWPVALGVQTPALDRRGAGRCGKLGAPLPQPAKARSQAQSCWVL